MTSDHYKAAHRQWFEALLERGDDTDLSSWFSSAHLFHQSLVEPLGPGFRGLRRAIRRLRRIFNPWLVQIEDQIATDNRVLTRFAAQGKHIGPLGPMQPTGDWTPLHGMLLSRFSGDRAYESWLEIDALDALLSIGAVQTRPGVLLPEPAAETGDRGPLHTTTDELEGT